MKSAWRLGVLGGALLLGSCEQTPLQSDAGWWSDAGIETTRAKLLPFNGVLPPSFTPSQCPQGFNVIIGTAAGEPLNGTAGNDCIFGLGGNDIINGRGGDDIIIGGAGNDDIVGGDGDDLLDGGAGEDTIGGGAGRDALYGGADRDTLRGNTGNDVLYGQGGGDVLWGDELGDLPGNDTLYGGDGGDSLYGVMGNDVLDGGAGEDILDGGAHNDTLIGGGDRDLLYGGDGDDNISGGAGNDRIWGQSGADTINGDAGNDEIDGGTQSDIVRGGIGDDTIYGGDGQDLLQGDAGSDTIDGQGGHDIINGNAGANDRLYGGSGLDSIRDPDSNTTINGGPDTDTCVGTACERPLLPACSEAPCGGQNVCAADFCVRCVTDTDCDDGNQYTNDRCSQFSSCINDCPSGNPYTNEVCDRYDNDCDGTIDEGVQQVVDCGCGNTTTSQCRFGQWYHTCPPRPDEICNAVDDDCDTRVDENLASVPITCGQGACESEGTRSCVGGVTTDQCPELDREVCDGIDNDCNGAVDEGIAPTPSPTQCGFGPCRVNATVSCVAGQSVTTCQPATAPSTTDATCDNVDDDCSGAVDEDYVPRTACVENGRPYLTQCVSGVELSQCKPDDSACPPCNEDLRYDLTCNGCDDDCDDLIDENCDICGDGIDNDGNGTVDCYCDANLCDEPDERCEGALGCPRSGAPRQCGEVPHYVLGSTTTGFLGSVELNTAHRRDILEPADACATERHKGSPDVLLHWYPPATSSNESEVFVIDTAGSEIDTVISVYRSCGRPDDDLQTVTCSDDALGSTAARAVIDLANLPDVGHHDVGPGFLIALQSADENGGRIALTIRRQPLPEHCPPAEVLIQAGPSYPYQAIDEDLDGLADCDDPECLDECDGFSEGLLCTNGVNDNEAYRYDEGADCADVDCYDHPLCCGNPGSGRECPSRHCGAPFALRLPTDEPITVPITTRGADAKNIDSVCDLDQADRAEVEMEILTGFGDEAVYRFRLEPQSAGGILSIRRRCDDPEAACVGSTRRNEPDNAYAGADPRLSARAGVVEYTAQPNERLLLTAYGPATDAGFLNLTVERVELGTAACTNRRDDDGDRLVDCEDPDCQGTPCREIQCGNGIDDDGNGAIDCEDSSCDDEIECAGGSCAPRAIGPGTTPGTWSATGTLRPGALHTIEACGPRLVGKEELLQWTPPAFGTYVIDTRGSDVDTVLTVGICGGRDLLCNDDSAGDGAAEIVYTVAQVSGQTAPRALAIQVFGYGGAIGDFVVNVREQADDIEICNDQSDNDADGDRDCEDAECAFEPICRASVELCGGGVDEDADGDTDCDDSDCAGEARCDLTFEACPGPDTSYPRNEFTCLDPNCRSIDSDHDGVTDCGADACPLNPALLEPAIHYADRDADGLGDPAVRYTERGAVVAICGLTGWVTVAGDCRDTDPRTTGARSDANCNGADEDCDGVRDDEYVPVESSCGYGVCRATGISSCVNGTVQSNCTQSAPTGDDDDCDVLDDDCDARIDEGHPVTSTTCGQGACTRTGVESCVTGQVVNTCVASEPGSNDRVCDGIDEDCDGSTDEHYLASETRCGSGACAALGTSLCVNGAEGTTCQPGLPAPNDHTCDGIDDDCDDIIDEDVMLDCYEDLDRDEYSGNSLVIERACSCGPNLTSRAPTSGSIDCNDADANVYPGASEACNEVDNDCDGAIDEGEGVQTICYADGDSDGFGSSINAVTLACECGPGTTPTRPDTDETRDCDDGSAVVYPGAAETCDQADNDCDGTTDEGACIGPTEPRTSWTDIATTLAPTCSGGSCHSGSAPLHFCVDPTSEGCWLNFTSLSPRPPCAGTQSRAECADRRIGNGSMPLGRGCGGYNDDRPECVAEDVAPLLRDWIAIGSPRCAYSVPRPDDDSCDRIDDDCDGRYDEDYSDAPAACGTGACTGTTVTTCVDGEPSVVCDGAAPGVEACNEIDDDCDGTTDEGIDCGGPYIGSPCTSDEQCAGIVGARDPYCYSENEYELAGGLCLSTCDDGTCPDGSWCLSDGTNSLCAPSCRDDGTCRRHDARCAWEAGGDRASTYCLPFCEVDADCSDGRRCDRGYCRLADPYCEQPSVDTDVDCDGYDYDCDGTTDEGYRGISECSLESCAGTRVITCNDGTFENTCDPASEDCTVESEHCVGDEDCASLGDNWFCMNEGDGFVGGRCVMACDATTVCPSGTACLNGACFVPCLADGSCVAPGDVCVVTSSMVAMCVPFCSDDSECINGCGDETHLCDCQPETLFCDRIDNDCDGVTDEVAGDCPCLPDDRLCDGFDDDCDGNIDENADDATGLCRPLACPTGARVTCDAGDATCAPGPGCEASCVDGADNDGDSNVDCDDTDCALEPECGHVGAGSPCLSDADCAPLGPTGRCHSEATAGLPGGYCTSACSTNADCEIGELCNDSLCVAACLSDRSCVHAEHECVAEGVLGCIPRCDRDGDCRSLNCNEAQGRCLCGSEICNGIDDDCDGEIDDGLQTCSEAGCTSATACEGGTEVDCNNMPDAGDTTCDGVDDDCDGNVDDDFVPQTVSCGACSVMARSSCTAGVIVGSCPNDPCGEDCHNGIDDDGNGQLDCVDYRCAHDPICVAGSDVGRACSTHTDCPHYTHVIPLPEDGNPDTPESITLELQLCHNDVPETNLGSDPVGFCEATCAPTLGIHCPGGSVCIDSLCVPACDWNGDCREPWMTCGAYSDQAGVAHEACIAQCDDDGVCPDGKSCTDAVFPIPSLPTAVCRTCADIDDDCDDHDDDCDGLVDEDYGNGTGHIDYTCGVGRCQSFGWYECWAGVESHHVCEENPPLYEHRNGLDDDCDGTIDDAGGMAPNYASQTCTTDMDCPFHAICVDDPNVEMPTAQSLGVCVWATCANGVRDGEMVIEPRHEHDTRITLAGETGIDCGGLCPACPPEQIQCEAHCAGGVTPRTVIETLSLDRAGMTSWWTADRTYIGRAGRLETVPGHYIRYELVNGVRVPLFEGVSINWYWYSDVMGNGPPPEQTQAIFAWSATTPGGFSDPIGTLDPTQPALAPDGTTQVPLMTIPAGGVGPYTQNSIGSTLSFWGRTPDGIAATTRISNPGNHAVREGDPPITTYVWTTRDSDTFTIADTWQRFSTSALPYNYRTLLFDHAERPSDVDITMPGMPAIGEARFYAYGFQYEPSRFPTSYIPTQGEQRQRNPDVWVYPLHHLPAWFFTAPLQLDVYPEHGSDDIVYGDGYVLLGFEGETRLAMRKRQDSTTAVTLFDAAGNVAIDAPVSWQRNQKLTITVQATTGLLVVETNGATVTAPALHSIQLPQTDVRIGGALVGNAGAFARISEVRRLSEETVACDVQDNQCSADCPCPARSPCDSDAECVSGYCDPTLRVCSNCGNAGPCEQCDPITLQLEDKPIGADCAQQVGGELVDGSCVFQQNGDLLCDLCAEEDCGECQACNPNTGACDPANEAAACTDADNNDCTAGECAGGACVSTDLPVSSSCDGGTGTCQNETSGEVTCDHCISMDCDDGNACTADSCDDSTCSHIADSDADFQDCGSNAACWAGECLQRRSYAEVYDAIFRTRCEHCHGGQNGLYLPCGGHPSVGQTAQSPNCGGGGIQRWECLEAFVSSGYMPPGPNDLSSADLAIVRGWIANGHPAGPGGNCP